MNEKPCIVCGRSTPYSICSSCDKKSQDYDIQKIRILGNLESMLDKDMYGSKNGSNNKFQKLVQNSKYSSLEKKAYSPVKRPEYKSISLYDKVSGIYDSIKSKGYKSNYSKPSNYASSGAPYSKSAGTSYSASKSGNSCSSGNCGSYK
jgi:hypothetical protein